MFKMLVYIGCVILAMNGPCFSNEVKIVTVNSLEKDILKRKTVDIQLEELSLAREIVEKLYAALAPFGSAAGLAAPQIGISRSIFIYSFDRDFDHLEVVINPTLNPVGTKALKGWEGCFSVILGDVWKLAYVPRYEMIDVTYLTLEGKKVEKRLSGFAAKVFQHEFDHLQGIESINREDAVVREFPDEEALMSFLEEVKIKDSKRY